jgi:hypothetical protein
MGYKIKCLNCEDVLESKHRHDFKRCRCENQAFIDGGKDCCRIGAMNLDLIIVLGDEE